MFPEPSAPPLIDLLKGAEDENDDAAPAPVVISSSEADCHYNCEAGCDVEFLVGKDDADFIRIPVHSQKLRDFPVFNAMLSENYPSKYKVYYRSGNIDVGIGGGRQQYRKLRQIRVDGMDRKAFDNVMKYVYKQPVHLQAPEITVETLKAAHEFLLPGLVRACVKHLSKMLSLSNVLYIFANVRYLCNDLINLEELVLADIHLPLPKRRKQSVYTNAMPISSNHVAAATIQNGISNQCSVTLVEVDMKNLCLWLLCQCLAFIDVHADRVLESDDLEELNHSDLKFLLTRDSLDVSEIVVFSALVRWAETKCKRQHLPLTSESKRLVLHDLVYAVRFFQMSLCDFQSGPGHSGLLCPAEDEYIRTILLNHHNPRLPFLQPIKPNLCCGTHSTTCPVFTKDSGNNVADNLQALKLHEKYFSKPRLRNGVTSSRSDRGRKGDRRKSSIFGGQVPKKGLLKFKRIGFIVKNFCIPCTSPKSQGGWNADVLQNSFYHHISEEQNEVKMPSRKNDNATTANTAATRPRTLSRRESTISKACDYTLRAFAFFFD